MGEDFYIKTKESLKLILKSCTIEILNQVDTKGRTTLDLVISSQGPFEIQDLIIELGGIALKNKRLFLSNRYQTKLEKRLKSC